MLGSIRSWIYEPVTGICPSQNSPSEEISPPAATSVRTPNRAITREPTCAPTMIVNVCGRNTRPATSGE